MDLSTIKNIIEGIKRYYPVSEKSLVELTENFTMQNFTKGHLLTRAGKRDNYVYFIEKGCTRTYFLVEGKEITNWFSKEGDITFSSNALYHQKSGFDYVQLLEDSILYTIPITTLNNLYEKNIEIANWSRIIHQEVLLKMQTLRIDRLALSARERYEKYINEAPDMFNRVNLGHISSYLGMTQQHLSNLRSSVRF